MKNKFLISGIFIFLFSILYANGSSLSSIQNTDEVSKSKKLNTFSDYKELESSLISAYNFGDRNKSLALSSLYIEDIHLKDGTIIKKDLNKAIKYARIALKDGFGLAALTLISIDESIAGNIDMMLLTLEEGIKAKNTLSSSLTILAVTYNTIILDYKAYSENYIKKALDLTYPLSLNENIAVLDFTIANLLNLVGNYEEANKYLNTACNNPKIDIELKKACNQSVGITNKEVHTKEECSTCQATDMIFKD